MVNPVKRPLAAAMILSLSAAGIASAGEAPIPYGKVPIPSAGVEIPVPLDWVRIPMGSGSGAEAQYVSVKDMAELDVFSVPFQSDFGDASFGDRAAELMAFSSPLSRWTDMKTRRAVAGDVQGIEVRASWKRADQTADVLALAFPIRGRSVIVLLIMAQAEGSSFAFLADLLASRTTITDPPGEVDVPASPPTVHEDPRGFSLAVPSGWRRVMPAEVEALAVQGGGEGEEGVDPASTIGFVRAALARQSPNMIIDVSEATTIASEAGREEMEDRYRMLVGQRGSDFTLDAVSLVRVSSIPSLLALGRMEAPGGTVLQSQYFVPVGTSTLILTFSLPENLADRLEAEVDAILGSLSLSGDGAAEPPPPRPEAMNRRDLLPWAAGGTALLAIVVVIVMVASRRRGRA